jgi:hypothetical protein
MPTVEDVGEPGAGEPHARFDEAHAVTFCWYIIDPERRLPLLPVGTICVQVSGFGEAADRLAAVPGLRPV